MGSVRSDGYDLYYEEVGDGVPILLIHPSGSTASTWGSAIDELARVGRVITYDRRGYARSGGDPVRKLSTHTADAAALLEFLQTPPAVVVGTSSGAMIALDLAVHRPAPGAGGRRARGPMAVHPSPSDGSAGQDLRHHGVARSPWPPERRRRGVAALGLCLPRRRIRVGRLPRRVAAGRQGERKGDPVGLPHHDRQPSNRDGSRDNRGPGHMQLRLTESRLHGPLHPIACRRHPRREDAANRRSGSRGPIRRNDQLRAADRRHHHLGETETFWVHMRIRPKGCARPDPNDRHTSGGEPKAGKTGLRARTTS
jgi:pimeloyl-ACP methyl ester carboxylesterase